MRKLIIIIVAAALVWAGYWFIGAHYLKRGLADALTDMEQSGWILNDMDYKVRGFPNRFDTFFDDVDVTAPNGIDIQAPFFQIFALSYKPNQIIVALPPEILVESAAGGAVITNDRARGSLTVQTAASLPLDHSSFVVDDLRIDSEGEVLEMDQLRFATRLPEGAPDASYQNIGLNVSGLALPAPLRERLEADGLGKIDSVRLDATLEFDAPLDRSALERTPEVQQIDTHDLSVDWGTLRLTGEGVLDVGADGRPVGVIELSINNWRDALDLAVSSGLLADGTRGQLEQALAFFGSGDALDLPLGFRDGVMSLGPLPIGPAPVLR